MNDELNPAQSADSETRRSRLLRHMRHMRRSNRAAAAAAAAVVTQEEPASNTTIARVVSASSHGADDADDADEEEEIEEKSEQRHHTQQQQQFDVPLSPPSDYSRSSYDDTQGSDDDEDDEDQSSFSEEGTPSTETPMDSDTFTSYSSVVRSDEEEPTEDELHTDDDENHAEEDLQTHATGSTETTQPTSPGRNRHSKLLGIDGNFSLTSSNLEKEGSETMDLDELKTPDLLTSSFNSNSPSRGQRMRVPGGAAAKLMLLGPRGSLISSEDEEPPVEELQADPSSESIDVTATVQEIGLSMQRAKDEFEKGSPTNRRYHDHLKRTPTIPEEDDGGTPSEFGSQAPSFLNRSEIFHRTAAAAVTALLTPRDRHQLDSQSILSDKISVTTPNTVHSVSAFQTPSSRDMTLFDATSKSFDSPRKEPTTQPLLPPEAERVLESLKTDMHDPTKTLTGLLTAIASPDDDSSQLLDLGFMVRRKNACGALQILTAPPANRVRIAWTVGVLSALTSVLTDTGDEGVHAAFSDPRIRAEYLAARSRAISTLMNLAMPKDNRIPIFHTAELIQALIAVILEDKGGDRKGCCSILAYLAKTQENRVLLAQVPSLIDAIVTVLVPISQRPESPQVPKDDYGWSSSLNTTSGENSIDLEDDADEARSSLGSPSASSNPTHTFSTDFSGTNSRIEASKSTFDMNGYDEAADDALRGARQSIFAMLLHLVKEKDNAYFFARESNLVATLVAVSKHQESPSHALAIKLLANLTRHRLNTKILVFNHRIVAPALVEATTSENDETRKFACYGVQNLAQDKSCRQELATTTNLIAALCDRARTANIEDERLAAISALKNLCDEPANLIPMTNTPDCIATLMHLAHGKEAGVTTLMQYRACDALATLSHWLRKIATSGQSLETAKLGKRGTTPSPSSPSSSANRLFVPSLRVVTWNQWQ